MPMAKQIRVQILHNQNERDSFFYGYKEGDPLVRVYDAEKALPYREHAVVSLEFIFEQNQWIGDAKRPWYDDARSLSVGDVIVLHDQAYACERIGFRPIDLELP